MKGGRGRGGKAVLVMKLSVPAAEFDVAKFKLDN